MRPDSLKNTLFLSGDEALALGAYEEGLMFAASYPGTPATEILEYLAQFKDLDCQWSVNEKVAFEVSLASSIAGRRSMFCAKHVGLNVAMDPLMTSAYTGVGAGFIVVTCDDPGLHSSQNEQDNRLIAKMAKIPLLEPSSPSEAKEFVKIAFSISEDFDTPVMLRLTTRIAHTKEDLVKGSPRQVISKGFKPDIAKYVMVPGNAYRRHIELEKRLKLLKDYSEKSSLNKIELRNKKIGFIVDSIAYMYVKEMYPDASILKLGMSFPFPAELAKAFSRRVEKLFVVEELEPFLEEEAKIAGIKCKAKHPSFRVGELRPEYVPLIVRQKEKPEELRNAKKPVLCPGCPHRLVFAVLKKLKLIVTGDIGCYTLGALPPLASLHTCLCMGSGITFFEGFRKSLKQQVVGVIGDSTFVHSGIAGLINLNYNQTKGVVIILDNGTTAMTGSQPHPATGVTIKGQATKKLSLEEICKACGADNVDVIDPYRIKDLQTLLKKRIEEDSLSVVIARHPCRLLKKEKFSTPEYEQEKCKRCYVCLALDCPALEKKANGYIHINDKLCGGCHLCITACHLGALRLRDEKE